MGADPLVPPFTKEISLMQTGQADEGVGRGPGAPAPQLLHMSQPGLADLSRPYELAAAMACSASSAEGGEKERTLSSRPNFFIL